METGTVVAVTGGARGLGRAVGEAFGAAGARVALIDLLEEVVQTAETLSASGMVCRGYVADTTAPEAVGDVAASIVEDLGPVDILVNNAGTFSYIGPVWEADPETWFRDVRTNLYGSFICCRTFVPEMVRRASGYVINIVSGGGVGDPHPHSTSYASSKTGLMRLTEGLAAETVDLGVKVFAVGPPAIKTAMTDFISDDEGGRKWRPTFKSIFEEGRDAPVDEIAAFIAALPSGRLDPLSGRFFDPRLGIDYYEREMDTIRETDAWTLRIAGRVRP